MLVCPHQHVRVTNALRCILVLVRLLSYCLCTRHDNASSLSETAGLCGAKPHPVFVVNYFMNTVPIVGIEIAHTSLMVCKNPGPEIHALVQEIETWCGNGGVSGCWNPDQAWFYGDPPDINNLKKFMQCDEYHFGAQDGVQPTKFGGSHFIKDFTVRDGVETTTMYYMGKTSDEEVGSAIKYAHGCAMEGEKGGRDFNENTYDFLRRNCHSFVNAMLQQLKLPYWATASFQCLPTSFRPEKLIRFYLGSGSVNKQITKAIWTKISEKMDVGGVNEATVMDFLHSELAKSPKCQAEEIEFERQGKARREREEREKQEREEQARREKEEKALREKEEKARQEKKENMKHEWEKAAKSEAKRRKSKEEQDGRDTEHEDRPADRASKNRRSKRKQDRENQKDHDREDRRGKRSHSEAFGAELVWQVNLGGKWDDVEPKVQKALAEAHSSGEESVELKLRGQMYEFNFVDNLQINTRTGKTRKIRQARSKKNSHFESARASGKGEKRPAKRRKQGSRAEAAKTCGDETTGGKPVWQVIFGRGPQDLDKECQDAIADQGHAGVVQCTIGGRTYDMDLTHKKQKNRATGKTSPLQVCYV
eukprot:TRINITY_DN15068_c0_g3_i1.p1 TRINITY_DN15068_c0_g3~~TRINITY_DN15068_c0_g3_i1.p1  ORF type:complete len:592 (-),score=71.41 TRINITY_DN15068_c0_g3_i1:194-1969(-)